MRKQLAIAAFAVASGFAHAQSSVAVYGILDTGVEYFNHAAGGGSFFGMPTLTGEVPSRFGLKGIEDLGGGYNAFFVLENGFAVDSGALNYGGRIFGRQANVWVSGEAGALTLGRQMNMSMYVFQNADVIGPSIHSIPNFDSYLANARSDNAVGYMDKFGGFTVGGTYSFGRDAAGPAGPSGTNCPGQMPGNIVACRQYTALLAYDSQNFGVAASYDVMRGGTGASAPLSSSAYTDTRTVVDGYVKYGDLKVGGGWLRRNTSAAIHTQSDIFFVGASYLISPAFSIDGEAVHYELRTQSNSTLLVARLNYFLSKRTTLYTSAGFMLNSRLAAVPVAAGGLVQLV
ncbi:MAG: Outer membrane porin protein 32 precursor; putative 3-hydroxyphenylpropionic acid porine [uncultured Paraburkholderia sp.]|nr:MAG: Outer membrane porin protein 32 precursor; putative 3-hydroxyphenylpropionic acid porine [uncultured Paraburkholderia sp.]CAH2943184.1 MAG: Outer membrane porin protein 32 precursor; putative 3-hydroxyphenylpropionic acid porine [uncultured Paraburkholderia sp.]